MLVFINLFFTFTSNLYHTIFFLAIRVIGAMQYIGFSKLLRLSSPNEAALGQLITFCTGDHERMHEAIVAGVLFLGKSYSELF